MSEATQDKGRVPFWIKALLFASLALNLGIVGVVAGAVWRFDGPGRHHGAVPRMSSYAAPYVRALPRQDRRAMFRAMHAMHADAQQTLPDRVARRALYEDVLGALRSMPFDAAALDRALGKQAEITLAVHGAAQKAWLEQVAEMTPEARRAYADAVEEGLRRGGNRGRHAN